MNFISTIPFSEFTPLTTELADRFVIYHELIAIAFESGNHSDLLKVREFEQLHNIPKHNFSIEIKEPESAII